MVFLSPLDDWYMKNKIPGESVEKARVKPSRIWKAFLCQENVEVLQWANPRLRGLGIFLGHRGGFEMPPPTIVLLLNSTFGIDKRQAIEIFIKIDEFCII